VNSAVLRRLAGALLLLLPVLAAAAVPAPAPASASIAFLDSFVGGTWTAPLPPGKAGDTRAIELVFSHTPNHQGIHFESTLLSGARRIPYTSGFYAWNAAKGRFAMFYTDSVGGLVSGDAAVLDNALLHELTETNKDGTVDQIKVRLTRVEPDAFTNEIYLLQGPDYQRVASVRYTRRPDPPHQP